MLFSFQQAAMLKLEPFWVYASVAFLVLCGRRQLLHVQDIWGNHYFTVILILFSAVFAPVENWIMLKHTDWESTFLIRSTKDSPFILALASCLHIVCATIAYVSSMYLLRHHGVHIVMKSAMWAFTFFFAAQGMFYDCLMYSGTFDEYHQGIKKSFWSFFFTQRFLDAYLKFSLMYGPPFFFLSINWNGGCTNAEKMSFIRKLTQEAVQHGLIICFVYIFLLDSGMLPARFDAWRLVPTLLMHCTFHFVVIAPQFLCSTTENLNICTSKVSELQEYASGRNGCKDCTMCGRKNCQIYKTINGF